MITHKKKFYSLILGILFINLFFLFTSSAQASLVDTSASGYELGTYGLNDFIILAISIAKWALGLVGTITLIMFIYGGFVFLISAGAPAQIEKAKKIIIAAVVGLAIVFSSYLIVKFSLSTIGLTWNGDIKNISIGNKCSARGAGFECMNKNNGESCQANLCPGDENIQCCKAKTNN